MIAAYVVLLPDMSRLRFTNVGEGGATGGDKGVWGRLGAPGRPSYAVLELALAGGERLIAGVQLQRKAEPTLELVPFIISGAPSEGRLRDLLLVSDGADEMVPDLDELRANVARAGARIQVFPTTKDYFGALFDRGITPLRLGTDEERNKLNEMLRTSMTGGISRALTSDLRAFLLKEETGLGDALSRMRANLDACHRTRVEVAEARRLERELMGVYDAGQAMVAAALLAARTRAEEQSAKAEAARAQADDASRAARSLGVTVAELKSRHEAVTTRLRAARARRTTPRARGSPRPFVPRRSSSAWAPSNRSEHAPARVRMRHARARRERRSSERRGDASATSRPRTATEPREGSPICNAASKSFTATSRRIGTR